MKNPKKTAPSHFFLDNVSKNRIAFKSNRDGRKNIIRFYTIKLFKINKT